MAVGDLHDIPVVQVKQFTRFPLDVVTGNCALPADMVTVDRGLVVVDVCNDVGKRGRAGGGQSFAYASRREPAFALCDMDARAVFPVTVTRANGHADGARHADTRSTGGEAHEGRGRRGVTVQSPSVQGHKQWCRSDGVAAKAEQVLETQAMPVVARQEFWRRQTRDLVAQGPHRVKAHRLVARRVRQDIGVFAVGRGEVVVEAVEQDAGHEAPRRDRTARMS